MSNVNYNFFVHYVESLHLPDGARVLDYGCGSGEILAALRENGIDAYGVDIYHKGISEEMQSNPLLKAGFISVIRFDQPLPYDDDRFDVIISNQVLEHVENIEFASTELSRILKPGGVMYHHFPSREAWREPHTGIPFSHKLPRDSAIRYAYTFVLRSLGLGYHKDEWPDKRAWTEHKLWYIDTLCFYRRYREITEIFGSYSYHRREGNYVQYRWGRSRPVRLLVATGLFSLVIPPLFRRFAFQAVEMRSTTPLPGDG